MSDTPRIDAAIEKYERSGHLHHVLDEARAAEREVGTLRECLRLDADLLGLKECERDNLQGARDWAVKRLYPFVLREAGPLPLPLERIAELVAKRLEYLGSVAPPTCPSCGCIREHMPCTESGTLTGCHDSFHGVGS